MAMGWLDPLSAAPAMERSSSRLKLPEGYIPVTLNFPCVSVPVLSKSTAFVRAMVSSTLPPFSSNPLLDAAPIPPKSARGTDMTRAHGQETTRNTRALYPHSRNAPRPARGGIDARRAAKTTTAGVYHLAKDVMNRSVGAFLSRASSMSRRPFESVDSPKGRRTSTRNVPPRLTLPASTSSPSPASRGTDSPVRDEVSREEVPAETTPSRGTRSPGLMRTVCPTLTSMAFTRCSFPFSSSVAESGRISMRESMERRDRSTAMDWTSSPDS